jgi:hypothetical protein
MRPACSVLALCFLGAIRRTLHYYGTCSFTIKAKKCSQVLARPDKKTTVPAADAGPGKVAGAFTERLRRGLPVLGLSVASLAVAGLATGEPTPAAGFGLFLMLIVGLSSVTIRAIGA